jgi:hypothetical protein
MKKFLGLCFTLFILGGIAFFFGWVQLSVPVGSYGVMRSKTHGLDPHIIRDGEFRWVWYKLIPTNVDIQIFTLHKIDRTFKIREELPSGREYASFAGFTVDFSYQLSGNLSFTIKPDALISLVGSQHILDQEGLEVFETSLGAQIETSMLQHLQLYTKDEQKIEEILNSGSISQLEQDIIKKFPDIENFYCFIQTDGFPDFTLYRQFRSIYDNYIERIREYIQTEQSLQPETRVASFVRLDELAKYGELLTKYPVLLEYLTLEKDTLK